MHSSLAVWMVARILHADTPRHQAVEAKRRRHHWHGGLALHGGQTVEASRTRRRGEVPSRRTRRPGPHRWGWPCSHVRRLLPLVAVVIQVVVVQQEHSAIALIPSSDVGPLLNRLLRERDLHRGGKIIRNFWADVLSCSAYGILAARSSVSVRATSPRLWYYWGSPLEGDRVAGAFCNWQLFPATHLELLKILGLATARFLACSSGLIRSGAKFVPTVRKTALLRPMQTLPSPMPHAKGCLVAQRCSTQLILSMREEAIFAHFYTGAREMPL